MSIEADIVCGEIVTARLSDFLEHYHQERNHQGQDNLLLFPVSAPRTLGPQGVVRYRERLGGLLKYSRAA
jgi:hypothetical protein